MGLTLSYGVLGPLEVRAGSTLVPVSAGKPRILLASLLVDANHVVAQDALIDRLWNDELPANPKAALAIHVLRLRRMLSAGAGSGDGPIRTVPGGYRLDVDPKHLDILRFAALKDAAARAADPGQERAFLAEALKLWRGPPLVDVPWDEFARSAVPQWEEDRLQLLERRIELDIARGGHADLVGELMRLVADHPIRERFWYQLMLALWRCQRRPEALDAFGRLRRTLADELGIDPDADVPVAATVVRRVVPARRLREAITSASRQRGRFSR